MFLWRADTVLLFYCRFDVFAEHEMDKNWTTKIGVNNIFDKIYCDAFYQSGSPFALIASGRSLYWKVEAKFWEQM